MLSKDELARLRSLISDYVGDDYPAQCDARRELLSLLPTALPTLLRIAEAVAEADVVQVGVRMGLHVPLSMEGQRVRLVRIDHGRSGEGEA